MREFRADKGINQKDLADAIGVTKSTISLYENGDSVPDIRVLSKIAEFYRVSYNYLLGNSINKKNENVYIGEATGLLLLGLKWSDIDLKNKTISVNRSIADVKGGGTKENSPKWESYRTNPLSNKAVATLEALGVGDGYIFSESKDRPQSPNTWSQKLERFMILMQSTHTDIPTLTAHELRHTYGTKLRRDGVDIYTIQKIMGHRDIKMTSEIYVHNEIETLKKPMRKSLK